MKSLTVYSPVFITSWTEPYMTTPGERPRSTVPFFSLAIAGCPRAKKSPTSRDHESKEAKKSSPLSTHVAAVSDSIGYATPVLTRLPPFTASSDQSWTTQLQQRRVAVAARDHPWSNAENIYHSPGEPVRLPSRARSHQMSCCPDLSLSS